MFSRVRLRLILRALSASGLALGAASLSIACDASGADDSGSQESNATGSEEDVVSVSDDSDFGNVLRIRGHVGFFEGETTLGLFNESQPNRPRIAVQSVHGSGMGVFPFDERVSLGDVGAPTIPTAGDCISVATVNGESPSGRTPEFGAFVYTFTDGRGDVHPSWATSGSSKLYRNAKECLADPVRTSTTPTKPAILEIIDSSDFGNVIELRGVVGFFEASADLVLRNESRPSANGPQGIASVTVRGGGMGLAEFQTSVSFGDAGSLLVPTNGDCVSVSTVSPNGTGALAEFGAFIYHHTSGKGDTEPVSATASKIFETTAECLAAVK